jgi:CubicO group peptidase (beta-lactamase class C family)
MGEIMSQEKFEKVVRSIKEVMPEHHVPGAAVGIAAGDQTFTTGLGVTNVDHPLEVTDETLFQIGSISKAFLPRPSCVLSKWVSST